MSLFACKNEAPQCHDEAAILQVGKTKLCRVLHRFGMFIIMTQ